MGHPWWGKGLRAGEKLRSHGVGWVSQEWARKMYGFQLMNVGRVVEKRDNTEYSLLNKQVGIHFIGK